MTKLPPLQHYEGGVRRGVLGSETGPAMENAFADDLDAFAVEMLQTWRDGALRVLQAADLSISPSDNLAHRLKSLVEPLSEQEAAAELVDAVNGALRGNKVARIDAFKLAGAYHKFAMLHFRINDDAALGQTFDKGPRVKADKARQRAEMFRAHWQKLPPVLKKKGLSQDAFEALVRGGLAKDLLGADLIRHEGAVTLRGCRDWERLLAGTE